MHFLNTLITIVAATRLINAYPQVNSLITDRDEIRKNITLPAVEKIITALEDPDRKIPDLWEQVYSQVGSYNVWNEIWTEVIHGFHRIKLPKYLETKKVSCNDDKPESKEDYERSLILLFESIRQSHISNLHGDQRYSHDLVLTSGTVMAYGCDYGCGQTIHLSDLIAIHAAIMNSCPDNGGSLGIDEWRALYGVRSTLSDAWSTCVRRTEDRPKCKH
ncbi:hypothetical protein EJ05DRAFT_480005 [Pseudovirgaria hyperparasitica]|uniref:Uncharacterized protein n=1 Tax=Pseudovirgaria hyperparasitica TaxID=470096 RepID=A0A6A6VTT7_9PEZI|nr:uncharacterized protein EJ05DRAFT_480005 [Pseudovirgaria hyperparasitica]KAF2753992.1 hypothetical protein EJ05DRAFT_480005 [Pseudovirgaria hyperparasitica]